MSAISAAPPPRRPPAAAQEGEPADRHGDAEHVLPRAHAPVEEVPRRPVRHGVGPDDGGHGGGGPGRGSPRDAAGVPQGQGDRPEPRPAAKPQVRRVRPPQAQPLGERAVGEVADPPRPPAGPVRPQPRGDAGVAEVSGDEQVVRQRPGVPGEGGGQEQDRRRGRRREEGQEGEDRVPPGEGHVQVIARSRPETPVAFPISQIRTLITMFARTPSLSLRRGGFGSVHASIRPFADSGTACSEAL